MKWLLFLLSAVYALAEIAMPELEVGKVGVPAIEVVPAATAAEELVSVPVKVAALSGFTLLPTPSPNALAGLFAGILWISIFLTGFCCLFSLEGQSKFVEKGLSMAKEY